MSEIKFKTVNKEKGIIAQEIRMYQDDPNWRLFLTKTAYVRWVIF